MNAAAMNLARAREVPLGAADVEVERRADGAILLRSPHPLSAHPARLTERLVHWARETPAQRFIAQRAVLKHRAALVEKLHANPPEPGILLAAP